MHHLFLLRRGMARGERLLRGLQAVTFGVAITGAGPGIAGMPVLVVGIVSRQGAAEATIGAKEEQRHSSDEAEDHIR
ncbi:MAG: hypothetical protein ACRDQH_02840 [Pseudonocardiaceae bacterium]